MKKSKKTAIIFILPFLGFFILFWLIPFGYGIYMSLHKYSLIAGNQGFIALENYIKILFSDSMYNKAFILGLKNTLIFVGYTTPLLVFLSLALALLIDRLPERCKGIFRTIYFTSYSVSVTAVSAIFIWLMKGNGGYFNSLLMELNILKEPIPWLELQPYVWFTLTIATVWWTIGYNMMLFINALNEVDYSLYEASAIDGAGFWSQFRYIIMPNIRNVFFFVLMTTIIASFNVYGQPRLMTSGGPGQSTKPLIMFINSTIMEQNNLGIGSAMTILMGIIIILISIGQYYMTKEKEIL
ncbi:carbohydrate ABC transporter permease [Alloiococcus sp. CFN-8]|uniref:carbohydrate ABC transporter permease n=1 Tax=Alloiococcus sp. CFN-8 TaxID=3416081 RepID=UPI003CF532C1